MAVKLRFHKGTVIIKPSHKGLLHKDTGTPAGEKIPKAKIEKAAHSEDPAVRRRAVFAENAAKWGK
jgi:hypothetical protein